MVCTLTIQTPPLPIPTPPNQTLRLSLRVWAYIKSPCLSFPLASSTRRFAAPFISQLSLRAVLHGTLVLLTTAQQLEQLNTVHDPPAAVRRISNLGYKGCNSSQRHKGGTFFYFLTAITAEFNDARREVVILIALML